MELTALAGTESGPFHFDYAPRQILSLWNDCPSLIFSRYFRGPLLGQLVQLGELQGVGLRRPHRLQQTRALQHFGGCGLLLELQGRSWEV